MTAVPAGDGSPSTSSSRFLRGLWQVVPAAVLLLFLGWGTVNELPRPGLDGSWLAALHLAEHSNLKWGSDLFFTYGPFGWLRSTEYWFEDTGRLSLAYLVVTRLVAFAALWRLGRPLFGKVGAWLILLPIAWAMNDPVQVLGVAGALWVASRGQAQSPRVLAGATAALGLLAGWELLGKVNVGVLVAVATVAGLVFIAPRRRALELLGVWGACFLVALVGGWLVAGEALGDLPAYLRYSAQIVSGYSNTMGAEDPTLRWQFVAIAVLWLAGCACAWFLTWPAPARQKLALMAVWTAATFFVYKAGFVRHDPGHSVIPFITLGPVALAFPWRTTWRVRVAALVLILAPIYAFAHTLSVPLRSFVDPVAHLDKAREQLPGLYDVEYRRARRLEGLRAIRTADLLSSADLAAVAGHTVDSWPWETALIYAAELRWAPQPVFQAYQAYTSGLDQLNSDRLASAKAPERVILGPNGSLDGRTASFDAPAAARQLLCRYTPVSQGSATYIVLARGADRCSAPQLVQTTRAAWGQTVTVPPPPVDGITYVEVEGGDIAGAERLRSALYRSHARTIEFGSAIGVRRLVPGTMRNGLILASGAESGDFPGGFALAIQAQQFILDRSDHPRGGKPLTLRFFQVRLSPNR